MSATLINTEMTAAVTAIKAADYATALTSLLAAKAYLAALPDVEKGFNKDMSSLKWDRESIDSLIAEVKKQQSAATGLRFQTIEWARPS